jgi:hypothetical protein
MFSPNYLLFIHYSLIILCYNLKKKWSKYMGILDKLERKFRKYAIKDLMKYIVIGQGIVYLLSIFISYRCYKSFGFSINRIMAGEKYGVYLLLFLFLLLEHWQHF